MSTSLLLAGRLSPAYFERYASVFRKFRITDHYVKITMELTSAEEKLILQHRESQEMQKQRKAKQLHLLETAYNYEKWLQEHGRGSSFTTFLDEFEYEGEKPSVIFKQVTHIREATDEALGTFWA